MIPLFSFKVPQMMPSVRFLGALRLFTAFTFRQSFFLCDEVQIVLLLNAMAVEIAASSLKLIYHQVVFS